jgi:hypothetical protein
MLCVAPFVVAMQVFIAQAMLGHPDPGDLGTVIFIATSLRAASSGVVCVRFAHDWPVEGDGFGPEGRGGWLVCLVRTGLAAGGGSLLRTRLGK